MVRSLDFHVTPHQLRHTYITRLFESGLDIKEIQYLAGHTTIRCNKSATVFSIFCSKPIGKSFQTCFGLDKRLFLKNYIFVGKMTETREYSRKSGLKCA